MMVFDFDNAIAIYDFSNSNNNMTIYTPISKPNMINYELNITNNQENYTLNIGYMMNDGQGMGTGIQLNKMDLFNLNNLNNLLSKNNLQLNMLMSNFDPTQELKILQNYNLPSTKSNLLSNLRGGDTNQSVQQDSGNISVVGKSNTPAFTPAFTPAPTTGTATATAIATNQSQPIPNPLAKCISQEVNQYVRENLNKLYVPRDTKNMIDGINGFLLNYNNYNIIKSQIDLFKTFTDDQIVCILESNSPNFCDNLDKGLSNDEHLNQLINGVKTSHEVMSLYQNQLLDIKTIVLPRVLTIINKCKNLTKDNKLKILNGLRNLLYTAEYLSSILGNNWDLIKNIDNTIKTLN